jgi:hypothetical protein
MTDATGWLNDFSRTMASASVTLNEAVQNVRDFWAAVRQSERLEAEEYTYFAQFTGDEPEGETP